MNLKCVIKSKSFSQSSLIFFVILFFFSLFFVISNVDLSYDFLVREPGKIKNISYHTRSEQGGLMVYLEAHGDYLRNVEAVFTKNKWKTSSKVSFRKITFDENGQVFRATFGPFYPNDSVEFYLNGFKSSGAIHQLNNQGLNYKLIFKKNSNELSVVDTLPKEKEVLVVYYDSELNDFKLGSSVDMILKEMIPSNSKEAMIHFSDDAWKTIRKKPLVYSEEKKSWFVNLGKVNSGGMVNFYITTLNNSKKPRRGPKDGFHYAFEIGHKKDMSERESIELIKKNIRKKPVRLDIEAIKNFKKNRPVVVALTTSPKRISKITSVIDELDLEFIDEVLVVIPYVYGRTQTEYVIPSNLQGYREKTKIFRIDKDLGPITKLLPAVEYVLAKPNGVNGVVITIDDDAGYPGGLIRELLIGLINKEKAVISGSVQDLDYWSIKDFGFPNGTPKKVAQKNRKSEYKKGDVVEGFSGIAYRVRDVDLELMHHFSQDKDFKACFVSDDLLISFILAYSGIERYTVVNKYLHPHFIKPLPYGLFGEDALHHGAGLTNVPVRNINSEKYQKCYCQLIDAFMDFDSLKLKDRKEILKKSV